jgi:hypothetical protein
MDPAVPEPGCFPVDDLGALVRTRNACHAVAEHVLAAALYAATGRIGLRFNGVGIGTPEFGDGDQLTFDGVGLIAKHHGERRYLPAPTIAAAARAIGISPGAPADVYEPSTPLEPDAPLDTDPTAIVTLWSWFRFGEGRLTRMHAEAPPDDAASTIVLWPEHFDLAFELGEEGTGSRGTFGASPGDAEHELPYLYVAHWSDDDDPRWRDPFWNDEAFGGASRSMTTLAGLADPGGVADAFFRAGLEIMRGRRSD